MRSKHIILSIVLCLAATSIILYLSTNDQDLSRYNNDWNGTSHFFTLTDRHLSYDVYNLTSLSKAFNSTLLLLAPERNYEPVEILAYSNFLKSGNTIILADDFGTGNSFLKGIGSNISIVSGILTSADRAYNDSHSIVAYPTDYNHTILSGIETLVMNKAASLLYGEPLATSSLFSWIDKDKDKLITKKEILGKYTVIAFEKIGDGEIIVISDPSIFINSMINLEEKWDNKKFISNIISLNPNLYIDQTNSKTYKLDTINKIFVYLKSIKEIKILFIGMILFLLAYVFLMSPYFKNKK
ncbi:MAG: DUF4350 domain-containing protein [Methanomicrobiales archaeon]|nr:DUF4350 domain-containing protein [Methanomicrobiales archaeon]